MGALPLRQEGWSPLVTCYINVVIPYVISMFAFTLSDFVSDFVL